MNRGDVLREGAGCDPEPPASIFTSMGEYSVELDRVFSAVSDATRRAILARLAESDARVTDVASAFPISLNSTSKHIRVLEGAGLVRRTVRGREHILSLDAAPLAEAAGWIEHYRRFWSDQLVSLDAFVTGRDNVESSS
jgi:DNA-binding transcriptional ArsR family regulator